MEEGELFRLVQFSEIGQSEGTFAGRCVDLAGPQRSGQRFGEDSPTQPSGVGENIPQAGPLKHHIVSIVEICVEVDDEGVFCGGISVLIGDLDCGVEGFLPDEDGVGYLDYLSNYFVVGLEDVDFYA